MLIALLVVGGLLAVPAATGATTEPTATVELAPGQTAVLLAEPTDAYTSVPAPEAAACTGCVGAAQATFQVHYTGFPPAARAAFQAAVDTWASVISSPVPIVIDAAWTSLPAGVLGGTDITRVARNFTNAPLAGTWYPIALANAIAGTDFDPSNGDIVTALASSGVQWYFGTDGNPPSGQWDLMSVALHEIAHGLGIAGTMSVEDGAGNWGAGTTSPLVFDRFTVNGNGTPLLSFPNGSAALAAQLTSNNLFFSGPRTNAANGGDPAKLYAPGTWNPGASFSHLDESTYPAGSPNSLMTPGIRQAESIHSPGPIALGILHDIGWPEGNAPPPPRQIPIERIFGQDAIGTSLAISASLFGADDAQSVVLARSDYFTDALAGGPLAVATGGPLLITPGAAVRATLDPRVLAEIQRVLPAGNTVFVLGGPLALSPDIDSQLTDLGYSVQRVMGDNQYSTATAIADRLGNPPVVFEATGLGFADALSAVPAAVASGGAILLTQGPEQAPETADYLATHAPPTRYAIGGPLAAAGADPQAEAVFGPDLFGTSAAVANRFFPAAPAFGAATGLDFPDALSGGVFMGGPSHRGPVLLVNPDVPVPPAVLAYLEAHTSIVMGHLFGGPLAVSAAVAAALSLG